MYMEKYGSVHTDNRKLLEKTKNIDTDKIRIHITNICFCDLSKSSISFSPLHTIQPCSGITSGRKFNGELYGQRLQKFFYLDCIYLHTVS